MRRFRDPDTLLFAALLVLHVVPLWCFPFFPSQDGPTHLENAAILRDYARRAYLHEFYVLNDHFDPNWFGGLVLAALMFALPPLLAEKVLLSGYVVLLPLATRYALNGVRPGAGWLAVLIFPFVHSFPFHMGFHNFCYSLGAFFLVVGYWLRHSERFGLRQTLTLAALAVFLYFCHLVAVVMAVMTLGVLGAGWTLLDARPQKGAAGAARPDVRRLLASRLLLPALAFVPALALGLGFVGRQGKGMSWTVPPRLLAELFVGLEVLVSYFKFLEGLLSRACFWGMLLLCGAVLFARLRSRQMGRRDLFLAVAALALVAYFTAPFEMSGGSFVNTRLSLFVFFFLILWLGAHAFAPRLKRAVQAGAAALALGLLAVHTLAYAEFNDYLAEYVAVEGQLDRDATVLPLAFSHQLRVGGLGDANVGAFRHAAGYLAARRGVVELENYEATTGYFPVRYRPEVNPFIFLSAEGAGTDGGLQAEPPEVDFLDYGPRTGTDVRVDYVLLWQARPASRATPAGRAIDEQLQQGYELAYESPRGLLLLYRRK